MKYIFYFTFLFVFLIVILSSSKAQTPYYHSAQGIVPLKIDSTKFAIKLKDNVTPDDQGTFFQQYDRIVERLDDSILIDGFLTISISTPNNYDEFLTG